MATLDTLVLTKPEKIEEELHNLRLEILKKREFIRLEGIWPAVEVTEEDFQEAKQSLFKGLLTESSVLTKDEIICESELLTTIW